LFTSSSFWAQLGLHAVVAGVALAAGMTIDLDAGSGAGGDLRFLVALVLTVVAAASAAVLIARPRLSALRHERAARRAAEARVHHLARQDALTGLLNRGVLVERLAQTIEGNRQGDRMVAVLVIDLDDFKGINDELGHAAGDLLLRHTAARLLASLRESDVVARMGADEFAVVQSEVDGPATVAGVCERLLEAMAEPFDLLGRQTHVGASIGVALHPADGNDPEQLLKHAGLALHRAKAEGGKAFTFFEEGMDAEMRERRALQHALHGALERGELTLYYQPQFDIGSRRLVGAEALLRWHHPEHGRIPPDVFIPLAEDTGLIVRIGTWVLNEACAQAVRWQRAGAPGLNLSVNLSPVQFRHPDLAALVHEILERTGLPAASLELEITERVLMENTARNIATLERLRALGVKIAIDDFGVGHSSLGYLHRFSFDEVKIDRSFVGALEADHCAAAIVRATLTLGRNLGMATVAEGVETAEQLTFLDAAGCDLAQGYYFSPPVPAPDLTALVYATAGRDEPTPDETSRQIA